MPATYTIFDADNDMWAYRFLKGWSANRKIDFTLDDSHEIRQLTDRASETTIRRRLQERMRYSDVAIVLVGESTRYLYKFVRWELDEALSRDLPLIVVNLNCLRERDDELCPPIIREAYAVHVPFKLKAIRHALGQFPAQHAARKPDAVGPLSYDARTYTVLGLDDE